MWPIINKLFIWRETCFFDGSELKKQAAVVFGKELSLEILFLHTRGRRFTICIAPVERETSVSWEDLLTGQFWAPKLPTTHYFLSREPLLCPQLFILACEHLIWMEKRLLPLVHSQPVCSVRQMQTPGRSTHQHMPVSCYLCGHYTKGFLCIVPK